MKNKLEDVNNHLIMAMERLNDDELCKDPEDAKKEIQKAQALSGLAEQVINIHQLEINNRQVQINAMKIAHDIGFEYIPDGITVKALPELKPNYR